MYPDKNNDKNKANLTPPPPARPPSFPSTAVTVFLIAEKLLNLDFEIFKLSVFY